MGKGKRRVSRIDFDEWRSASFWKFNTGSILCDNCYFHRSLRTNEYMGNTYDLNNSVERYHNCPKCGTNKWLWMSPKARIPRKTSKKFKEFIIDLKNRKFN